MGNVVSSNPNINRRWVKMSNRWRKKIEKIYRADKAKITWLESMYFINNAEFCIAKGIDGTEIFLGLRNDGTEVAIKRISKCNNYQCLKNEEHILRLPGLDYPFITRYIEFVEDDQFGYLCVQLFEHTLDEYIRVCPEYQLYNIVRSILKSLKVLHDQRIFHWDLKPQNFWIDITRRVRLAGFGLCRWSPDEETTLYTGRAEAKNWMANETLTVEDNGPLNWSTDIQGAGMLIDYVLSRGQHQFHISIHKRTYNLDQDFKGVLAKDLIEWMTDPNPNNRPGVQNCLNHPFLWSPIKKLEYLINIGKRKEVAMFKEASQDSISSLEAYAADGYFRGWKNKFPADLVKMMDGKKKEPCYTDNAFGLLRFIRNAQEH
ncbi:serine/threonine-protein kinase/endoribonuclease IRE1-like, partial [Scomber scombrus]